MTTAQIAEKFQMKFPIGTPSTGNRRAVFWNGKPSKWSNLEEYRIHHTQDYGQNALNYAQFKLAHHNGIDIGFVYRTPLIAPTKIFITGIDRNTKGYGNTIYAETESKTIDGKTVKLELVFAHLDEITCEAYQWYEAGTLLGYGDSTGFSTGHHLHLGIFVRLKTSATSWQLQFADNGVRGAVDPRPFLPKIYSTYELRHNPIIMDLTKYPEHLVQLVEGTGGFGVIVDGKLLTGDTADVLATFTMRNGGETTGRTVTFTQSQWNSVPHYNLKHQLIYNP